MLRWPALRSVRKVGGFLTRPLNDLLPVRSCSVNLDNSVTPKLRQHNHLTKVTLTGLLSNSRTDYLTH